MNNQPNNLNMNENQNQQRGISIGAALILGLSAIIVALIIAAALIITSGAKIISDLPIENFDGLEINVNESGEQTPININLEEATPPIEEVGNNFSELGFSVTLPDDVTAGTTQQSEGGPWEWVQFSDGTMITSTDNLAFDNQYGAFPDMSNQEFLVTIGSNVFFVTNAAGGRTSYSTEKNGRRYQILQDSGAQIDVATFQI